MNHKGGMIRLEFQYTAEDPAEEAKARNAVFAGLAHSERSAAARLQRTIRTIEESDRFRGMVVNQIPRGEFLPPATGFPVAEMPGFPVVPTTGGR